jgi:4-hydroxymandelate oxidase
MKRFARMDFVRRLKDATGMKVLINEIVTREDAQLAGENGVDGVIVSNQDGRAEAFNRSTVDSLPQGDRRCGRKDNCARRWRIPSGTAVFKALALNANAICIGRPYVWGLVSAVRTARRRDGASKPCAPSCR